MACRQAAENPLSEIWNMLHSAFLFFPINIKAYLLHIMTLCHKGDRPLLEPLKPWYTNTHIYMCISRHYVVSEHLTCRELSGNLCFDDAVWLHKGCPTLTPEYRKRKHEIKHMRQFSIDNNKICTTCPQIWGILICIRSNIRVLISALSNVVMFSFHVFWN